MQAAQVQSSLANVLPVQTRVKNDRNTVGKSFIRVPKTGQKNDRTTKRNFTSTSNTSMS